MDYVMWPSSVIVAVLGLVFLIVLTIATGPWRD